MTKVCLIIRAGFDANFIVSKLNDVSGEKYKVEVILETGKKARKKKLKRMIRKKKLVKAGADIAALLAFDRLMTSQMGRIIGGNNKKADDSELVIGKIEDVNDKECITLVQKENPDIILVYGTGIIKPETIRIFEAPIYNIHSSILPYYRNVHSDFWAYMNDDLDKIGISVIRLDEGIDTGNIVMQRIAELPKEARLSDYKARNLINIPLMVSDFIDAYEKNKLNEISQEGAGSISYTPGARDLMMYMQKEYNNHKKWKSGMENEQKLS